MKKYFLTLFLFSFLISCDDILKEEPKSVAVEIFYNTKGEVETAINAIYSSLKVTNAMTYLYPAQLEAYTDYCYGRGSYSILSEFQGLDNTNITRVGQMWTAFYLAIRNANIVITNVPNGSKISDADKSFLIAEARFLRAFAYFHLVRNWGRVILRTEQNMTEQNLPLSSADETYKLIIDDLVYAEQYLPDIPSVSGRATKWAAKTMLTEVYLTRGQNEEAKKESEDVINSKRYSLVQVSTSEDFQKIFGPNVITTPEEIFYLKYSREAGYGWSFVQFMHHPGDPYYNGKGDYGLYTDSEKNLVYKNWDDADLRKAHNWFKWNIGLGANTLLCRKFRDPERIDQAANDFPLYRYADLLLFYAEAACKANNGPTSDAMEKLNMVHRRAYGKDPSLPSEIDFKLADYPDQDKFLDLVLKERGYEDQCEAKRWLDLKRSGKVKEIIKAATGKDIADKHLLWPIPVSELNYNLSLDPIKDQNPGY